jgi:hypothetical protein
MSDRVLIPKFALARIVPFVLAALGVSTTLASIFLFFGSVADTPTLTSEAERRDLVEELAKRQLMVQTEAIKARRAGDAVRMRSSGSALSLRRSVPAQGSH